MNGLKKWAGPAVLLAAVAVNHITRFKGDGIRMKSASCLLELVVRRCAATLPVPSLLFRE